MARCILLTLAVVVLAGCGPSKPAASVPATTRAGSPHKARPVKSVGSPHKARPVATAKLDVRITAATHLPRVSVPWRYTVHVTLHGKPVPARISVQVLYQGTQAADLGSHLSPSGVWSGTFTWPPVSKAHMLMVSARATSVGRAGTGTYQVAGQ